MVLMKDHVMIHLLLDRLGMISINTDSQRFYLRNNSNSNMYNSVSMTVKCVKFNKILCSTRDFFAYDNRNKQTTKGKIDFFF